MAINIKEERGVGHAQPGLSVEARIRVKMDPISDFSNPLQLDELAHHQLKPSPASTLIRFTPEAAGYQLLHRRNWQIMMDRGDLAVLRLVTDGDLVAQCNISKLEPPNGPPLSLQQFGAEIQRALGDQFSQVVDSDESDQGGMRVLRIAVAGEVQELPIQWIYYHVATNDQALSLVFTLDTQMAERFGAADRELVETVKLQNR